MTNHFVQFYPSNFKKLYEVNRNKFSKKTKFTKVDYSSDDRFKLTNFHGKN